MKQLIIAALTTILLSSCNGSGEGTVTTSSPTATATPSGESEWAAKVIKASSPNKVATYGGLGSRETPSKGQQWVSLTVEVTPPDGENLEIKQFHVKVTPGDVLFKTVQITDGSKNIYPVLAIDCPKKNNTSHTYLSLESLRDKGSIYLPRLTEYAWHEFTDEDHGNRVAGFVFANVGGDWVVYVWDYGFLRFQPKRASTAYLLFEIPTSARQLAFQIGNSRPTPIQIE